MRRKYKIFLYLTYPIILIFIIFLSYVAFIYYDWKLSESGKMSNEFNKKIQQFIKEEKVGFELKELTDFEWNKVCFYSGDGEEYIDLKDQELIKEIGFEPKTLIRSKFWIDYDFSGLLFVNTKNQKVYVLRYLNAWHHLPLIASNSKLKIRHFYDGCYDKKENLSFSIKY
jgi:hypothetical protein